MLVKSIFMELRSRLRSCSVFIKTNIDFRNDCSLKVNIQSDCIVLSHHSNALNEDDDISINSRRNSGSSMESLSDCFSEEDFEVVQTIDIKDFCRLIPNSMSGLIIENTEISFRILTESQEGDFHAEFLTAASNGYAPIAKVRVDLKINDSIKIVCENCANAVSNDFVSFSRILELPSENLDASEWFCHNHGGSDSGLQTQISLKPKKSDLFHRLTYFLVEQSQLSEKAVKFNKKHDIFHCNRCLAWLGLKSDHSVTLYNSTVKIHQNSIEKRLMKQTNTPFSSEVSVNDFIITIEYMMKEFNLGLQYAVMCKIILKSQMSSTENNYILLWIMDKELQVLKGEHSDIHNENDHIKLISNLLTKVLYKIVSHMDEEVETWLADPTVTSTDISKNMFFSGVEHLRKMSLNVPESFRVSNGYFVSYLKV